MLFLLFSIAIALIAIAGIYCIIATHNLLRVLIALEIVGKAALLLLLLAGIVSGRMAEAESFIIVLIIVEVVVTAIGAVLCVAIHARTGSLDIRLLSKGKESTHAE